jgi:uncharacterized membrane protein YdbT with pleckstrin-like domain
MMTLADYKKVRFEGEEREEETLFFLRAHGITNLNWIITGLVSVVLPIFLILFVAANDAINLPIGAVTVALGLLIWYLIVFGVAYQQFVRWFFNIYILTNKRIVDIDFYGLFHRKVSQTTLGTVQDVTYTKAGILQNFFDYGDIHLQTAGAKVHFDFAAIPDPEGSQKQILDLVAKYKRKGREIYGTRPSQSAGI